jgi:hypothetical protein
LQVCSPQQAPEATVATIIENGIAIANPGESSVGVAKFLFF